MLLDIQQDISQFFILLNERKNNINKAIDGKPILHFLVSKSEEPDIGTDLIKTILNLGVNINAEDNSGSSALYVLSSGYIGRQNVHFFYCSTVFKMFFSYANSKSGIAALKGLLKISSDINVIKTMHCLLLNLYVK